MCVPRGSTPRSPSARSRKCWSGVAFDQSNTAADDAVEARARKCDRIRWHARRGLLENDLILTRFLDAQLASLESTEMTLLEELLRWGDNDLL
ncbi:MAG: succinate dehydrogenase assembly factor 2, partial [Betaproteobacteria bacterium]